MRLLRISLIRPMHSWHCVLLQTRTGSSDSNEAPDGKFQTQIPPIAFDMRDAHAGERICSMILKSSPFPLIESSESPHSQTFLGKISSAGSKT